MNIYEPHKLTLFSHNEIQEQRVGNSLQLKRSPYFTKQEKVYMEYYVVHPHYADIASDIEQTFVACVTFAPASALVYALLFNCGI